MKADRGERTVHKVSDCARFFPCKPVRHGTMLPSLQRNEIEPWNAARRKHGDEPNHAADQEQPADIDIDRNGRQDGRRDGEHAEHDHDRALNKNRRQCARSVSLMARCVSTKLGFAVVILLSNGYDMRAPGCSDRFDPSDRALDIWYCPNVVRTPRFFGRSFWLRTHRKRCIICFAATGGVHVAAVKTRNSRL
jgi:hypothetical protein